MFPRIRVTLDDLTRLGSMKAFYAKRGNLPPADETHDYAKVDNFVTNHGGRATFNLWSPYTAGSGEEFSLSQMWVVRGSGTNKQTVEAGWQKYQDKYGDWQSHLFIFFTSDGYDTTGCYNLDCSAFVQTNNTVTLGGTFANYSTSGGTQHTIELTWHRDTSNGNWWLGYGTTWVGYYPASLFDSSGIGNQAARVSYGGEVAWFDNGPQTATDMGSGAFPSAGWQYAAYTRNIQHRNTGLSWVDSTGMSELEPKPSCYNVVLSESSGTWKSNIYFGGSGNNANCP